MELENLKKEEKSSWGGAREGSGRKHNLQYEMRDLFNKAVDDEWEDILKAVISNAKKGDKETLKWVVEQRIGKAPQSMVIDAKGSILNVQEPVNDANKIDIMSIAKEISERIKKEKTEQ